MLGHYLATTRLRRASLLLPRRTTGSVVRELADHRLWGVVDPLAFAIPHRLLEAVGLGLGVGVAAWGLGAGGVDVIEGLS